MNDDVATLQINLSNGSVYIDGEPMVVWHVPLATSQPPADRRRAHVIAQLLAKRVPDYSAHSLEQLQAMADEMKR